MNKIIYILISFFFFNIAFANEPRIGTNAYYTIGNIQPDRILSFLPNQIDYLVIQDDFITLSKDNILNDLNKTIPHDGILASLELKVEQSGVVNFFIDNQFIYGGDFDLGYHKIDNLKIEVKKNQTFGVSGSAKFKVIKNRIFEKEKFPLPIKLKIYSAYIEKDLSFYGIPIHEEPKLNATYIYNEDNDFNFSEIKIDSFESFLIFKLFSIIFPLLIIIVFILNIHQISRNYKYILIFILFAIILHQYDLFYNLTSNLLFFATYYSLYSLFEKSQKSNNIYHSNIIVISVITIAIAVFTIAKISYIYCYSLLLIISFYHHKRYKFDYAVIHLEKILLPVVAILTLSIIDLFFSNFTSIKYDGLEHLARSADVFRNNFSFGEPGVAFAFGEETFSNAYNLSIIPFITQYFFFYDGSFEFKKYQEFFDLFSLLHYAVIFCLIGMLSGKKAPLAWSIFLISFTIWNTLIFLSFFGLTDHAHLFFPTEFVAAFLVPLLMSSIIMSFAGNKIMLWIAPLIMVVVITAHIQNLIIFFILILTCFLFTLISNDRKNNFIITMKVFSFPGLIVLLSSAAFVYLFNIPEIDTNHPLYYNVYRYYPLNLNFFEGHKFVLNQFLYVLENNWWIGLQFLVIIISVLILIFIKNSFIISFFLILTMINSILQVSYTIQEIIVPITSYRPFQSIIINFGLLNIILFSSLISLLITFIVEKFVVLTNNTKSSYVYSSYNILFMLTIVLMIYATTPFISWPNKSGMISLNSLASAPIYSELRNKECFLLNNEAGYVLNGLSSAKIYYLKNSYGDFLEYRKNHKPCDNNIRENCVPKQCQIIE